MKSRVHPKYKTKYRITNWIQYDKALVKRGGITLWISEDAIKTWTPARSGRRRVPREYSGLAIETALTLRLVLWASASPSRGNPVAPASVGNQTRAELTGTKVAQACSPSLLPDQRNPPNRPPHRDLEWSGQRDSNPRHSAWERDAQHSGSVTTGSGGRFVGARDRAKSPRSVGEGVTAGVTALVSYGFRWAWPLIAMGMALCLSKLLRAPRPPNYNPWLERLALACTVGVTAWAGLTGGVYGAYWAAATVGMTAWLLWEERAQSGRILTGLQADDAGEVAA